MKMLIGIVAALGSVSASRSAYAQSFNLSCVGKGSTEGLKGRREINDSRYRIVGDGQHVSVRVGGYSFCIQGANCTVEVGDKEVHIGVRDIPQYDPGYSQHFRLDRMTSVFTASGGGLDGGWSITGKCKPERS
ncbi:hypothetical protein [Sphingomonas koreensis]